MDRRESEGCIRAMTSGNGCSPDPVEQRRPVLSRTFGGKHDRCLDAGANVTVTSKGS